MDPEATPSRLGEYLRRAREARGWTIQQVEVATRIPRRHLEAIEADNLSALPPPVFTRGIVRTYAQHVGADPAHAEALLLRGEARSESTGVRPEVLDRPSIGAGGGVMLRAALFALLLGLAVGLTYVILPRYRSLVSASPVDLTAGTASAAASPVVSVTAGPPTATAVPTSTPPPTPTPVPTTPPTATMAPAAQATATAAAGIRGVTVEARATGRVWAQAEADGQVVFSGILQATERKAWKAERRITLHVGNAALVEVTYNGQTLGTLGPAGEVVKREWTSAR